MRPVGASWCPVVALGACHGYSFGSARPCFFRAGTCGPPIAPCGALPCPVVSYRALWCPAAPCRCLVPCGALWWPSGACRGLWCPASLSAPCGAPTGSYGACPAGACRCLPGPADAGPIRRAVACHLSPWQRPFRPRPAFFSALKPAENRHSCKNSSGSLIFLFTARSAAARRGSTTRERRAAERLPKRSPRSPLDRATEPNL